ncbi:MAG: DNA adenine methylase [Alistipes sp.]|nr:DNA adenine methylase [Alistipes sp.]
MKYIGNKTRLLDFIDESLAAEAIPIKGTFIDIFGGTGYVGRFYKEKGMKVISNDIMTYSYWAQYVLISVNSMPTFDKVAMGGGGINEVLSILNNPKLSKEGYIFENFAPGGKAGRQYFSDENAKRIDAIRDLIEQWKTDTLLSEDEYAILVYSLVDAADFVANIAGTYGAYLKIWRSMALKPIKLKVPKIFDNNTENIVYQQDANCLIKDISGDILYLDPPYNSRQYAPNFHLLETLSVWDKQPLVGKSGQREYKDKKSRYCSKKLAYNALKELVANAKATYIVLSYNDEGIISREEIYQILSTRGQVHEHIKNYRRFRTEKDHEKRHYKACNDRVLERLYIVKTV